MIKIEIENKLKSACPKLQLGYIQCKVNTHENCPELWVEIEKNILTKEKDLNIEKIWAIPTIESSKKGYRSVGKDPSRYRLSAEALLRRVVKGKGLYKINNVVDLLNLVSIESGFSIGGYNADKIDGNIKFGIGKTEEEYYGIGRGKLNIEYLPVFRDSMGAFGSPTSDSMRTSINSECTNFLMLIISFQNDDDNKLSEAMQFAQKLLLQYANASNIETKIIQ
ncbi:B3/B4 domain-containing protein [Marinifilum sp. RC60d5]|uniref:B3/B4 domain-containing protein n=1 Tax=Marinifilum sp. RC60d5 TaxID=3458414 RepID=UPI004035FAA2